MADETHNCKTELTAPSRRALVTKTAQVAVTAPAVFLLLNAYSKNVFAQVPAYLSVQDTVNRGADTDTAVFIPVSNVPIQDDHI